MTVHPGKILAEKIKEYNLTVTSLAEGLCVTYNRISEIINGKRSITADTALRLEYFLGIEADFWMNLQTRYELDITIEKSGEIIKKWVLPLSIK